MRRPQLRRLLPQPTWYLSWSQPQLLLSRLQRRCRQCRSQPCLPLAPSQLPQRQLLTRTLRPQRRHTSSSSQAAEDLCGNLLRLLLQLPPLHRLLSLSRCPHPRLRHPSRLPHPTRGSSWWRF